MRGNSARGDQRKWGKGLSTSLKIGTLLLDNSHLFRIYCIFLFYENYTRFKSQPEL